MSEVSDTFRLSKAMSGSSSGEQGAVCRRHRIKPKYLEHVSEIRNRAIFGVTLHSLCHRAGW
jgi:hypothetical protein